MDEAFRGQEFPEVMKLDEAADFLRCDVKTLRAAVKAGRVPAYRLGEEEKAYRFTRSTLLQFPLAQWHQEQAA